MGYCFYQLFGLSLRHPFTAEDVSDVMKKQTHLGLHLGVSTFSENLNFLANNSLKG